MLFIVIHLLTIFQAFVLPPQLYRLGPRIIKPLEYRCRQHFTLHAEWVHERYVHRDAIEKARESHLRSEKLYRDLLLVKGDIDSAISYAIDNMDNFLESDSRLSSLPGEASSSTSQPSKYIMTQALNIY